MPVVTPFGDLSLEDDIALGRWLDAHKRRHHLYVSQHIGPKGGTLDGPVDADWMARHAARHVALATVISDPLASADTKVLALPHRWQTEAELADWHDLHNRLHFHIDRVRKIVPAGHIARPGPPGRP